MKRIEFFFATIILSVALIACQKENIEPRGTSSGVTSLKAVWVNSEKPAISDTVAVRIVYYQVNVNLRPGKPLCNIYWVEMLDAFGRLVAPKQTFIPGTKTYIFTEQIQQRSGLRVARLVRAPGSNIACDTELFTSPAMRTIEFRNMETYTFDLYPQMHKTRNGD